MSWEASTAHSVLRARVPSSVGDRPEVSVVIVAWNSGRELLACLRSLQRNQPSVAWEAIVVDNGSTDGSIARVRTELPWVRVIANGHNRGLAAGNNQGIAASKGQFVLISNPDVIYGPGAIDALLDLLARRERAAFAVAKLVYPDGRLQTSAGDLPSAGQALLGKRLSRWAGKPAGPRMWWDGWAHDEECAVGHGAEACYLVRRDALGEIGLQDERFVLDWEGVDWSSRAWDAGWEVWFCPTATVAHHCGVSLRQVPGRWVASTHKGMYLYLSRRAHPLLRPLLALAVGARAVAKLAMLAGGVRVYELADGRNARR
jgi:N-acetylglucosaminyl-diphospho-decaprenol L-rhamnosyltransferase